MGDELTTNNKSKLELDFDELVDKIGFEPQPKYQWAGMTIDENSDEWSWMDSKSLEDQLNEHIQDLKVQIKSAYNDGYTALAYKKQLYDLKCKIEDAYNSLPVINKEDEAEWDKKRVFNKLGGTEE